MPNREGLHCGCDSERSCDRKRHCAVGVGIDGSVRVAEFTVACCLRSDAAFGSARVRQGNHLSSFGAPFLALRGVGHPGAANCRRRSYLQPVAAIGGRPEQVVSCTRSAIRPGKFVGRALVRCHACL